MKGKLRKTALKMTLPVEQIDGFPTVMSPGNVDRRRFDEIVREYHQQAASDQEFVRKLKVFGSSGLRLKIEKYQLSEVEI
jgi:hypothetical protein